MKKLTVLSVGFLLAFNFLAVAGPSEADQKWLQTVEKMVTKGETKVSTSSEDRVTLVKDWAEKKGYSVTVIKSEKAFRLELTSKDSSKNVVQK